MKRFFPILTASFCIMGLGAQVSSGMILPFEQFPDATADYKSTATPPVDTLFLGRGYGPSSCQPQGKENPLAFGKAHADPLPQ